MSKALETKAKAKDKADKAYSAALKKDLDKMIETGSEKHGSQAEVFRRAKITTSRRRAILSGKSEPTTAETLALVKGCK